MTQHTELFNYFSSHKKTKISPDNDTPVFLIRLPSSYKFTSHQLVSDTTSSLQLPQQVCHVNDDIPSASSSETPQLEELLALNYRLQEEIALLRSKLSIAQLAADFYFNEANLEAAKRQVS